MCTDRGGAERGPIPAVSCGFSNPNAMDHPHPCREARNFPAPFSQHSSNSNTIARFAWHHAGVSVSPSAPVVRDEACRSDRRLWLVRHGESTWNAAGLVQGQRDPGLSPAGHEQAARCARLLAEWGRPEAVYSSDLRRAVETAAPIADALGLPIFIEPRLRERSLGDAEGMPSASLGPRRSGVDRARVADADAAPEGGESVRQLYGRAAACLVQILASHRGDVVLVCHGGVVRVLLAWLDGIDPEDMTWPVIENALPIQRDLRGAPACA